MSSRPAWLTLAWWHEKDHAAKTWFAHRMERERVWTEEDADRLIAGLGHAIGWPCLLTPGVTRSLYPWLPEKNEGLMYLWAAAGIGIAILAHLKQIDRSRAIRQTCTELSDPSERSYSEKT